MREQEQEIPGPFLRKRQEDVKGVRDGVVKVRSQE